MTKLGDRLLRSVRQARADLRRDGIAAFRTHRPPDAREIRIALGLTQQAFADRFGLPVGSVRDWEQGRVLPDRAAQALLRVIQHAPDVVADALASSPEPGDARRGSPNAPSAV